MFKPFINFLLQYLQQFKWNRYSMEPIIFILVFSHSLSGTIIKHEVIYQACSVIFQYNESDCRQLGSKNVTGHLQEIETEVQPYVANLFMIRVLLESILPTFMGIFVGPWSDHYGRKPLLVVSLVGFSFTYLIAAIICEISRHILVNPWYYVLTVLPHSILGGNCVFSVAVFCIISDTTTTNTRPYRMISFEIFLSIGLTTGSLISSYIYDATNSTITFTISGLLMCFITLYTILFIPESLHLLENKSNENDLKAIKAIKATNNNTNCQQIGEAKFYDDNPKELTELDTNENCKDELSSHHSDDNNDKDAKYFHVIPLNNFSNENCTDNNNINKIEVIDDYNTAVATAVPVDADGDHNVKQTNHDDKELNENAQEEEEQKKKIVNLFSYQHIIDIWSTCFMPRPSYDRAIILLVSGTMFILFFVSDGVLTVFYLFVREKFQWTIRDYTLYETANNIMSICGAFFGFIILRRLLKLSVVTLALMASFSEIIRNFIQAFATEPWHLYLALGVSILRSIGAPMYRTIGSNIVPPKDLGKIFSIKNILQNIAPFLASPLYSEVYKASLQNFPGLFNIVSAFFHLISFTFLIFIVYFKIKSKDYYKNILN